MALLKIKDFDSNYRDTFGGYDIKGLDVYSNVNNEKIGSVHDLLVDEQGHFRYFILDLGFWGFGKKVLLPVGRTHIDADGRHIHALGFTKDQAETLPEFNESLRIDNSYEERVRGVYRSPAPPASRPMTEAPRQMPVSAPLEAPRQSPVVPPPAAAGYPPHPQAPAPGYPAAAPAQAGIVDPAYYDYQQEPALYGMDEQHHSVLQRYEQRLVAKHQQTLR